MFGKWTKPFLLGVAALWIGCGCGSDARGKEPTDSWRHATLWDDGKAEHAVYDVVWARYGHRYPGQAVLVLVKEPWAPDLDVKADEPRPDGFDVLKLNHIRDVPTGIYTYHQAASIFVRRDTGALQKIAATSSESCGISTAHMVNGTLETRSYFDGQGDRSGTYPKKALPEDALPALLRDYVRDREPPGTIEVFPSLLMGRYQTLRPVKYRLAKHKAAPITVPAGGYTGVQVELTQDGSSLSYVFDQNPPHALLRFESSDGTRYELAKIERIPYWRMHDPDDEAWYP